MPKAFRWQISVCSGYAADCMQTVTLSPPHGHIMSPLYDRHVDTRQGGTVYTLDKVTEPPRVKSTLLQKPSLLQTTLYISKPKNQTLEYLFFLSL